MAGKRAGGPTGTGRDEAQEAASRLRALGLAPGARVRFRRREGGHWHEGVATRIERDGSVGLVDDNGAARAISVARLEVRRPGRRGAERWEPLAEVAGREEQLGLFEAAADRPPRRR